MKIDDIIVGNFNYPANDLAAISERGAAIGTINEEIENTVTVFNAGLSTVSNYTIRLMKAGAPPTQLDIKDGVALTTGASHTFSFNWTPETAGSFKIFGEIVYTVDNLENNSTAMRNIAISPVGSVYKMIGNPESHSWTPNYPLCLFLGK